MAASNAATSFPDQSLDEGSDQKSALFLGALREAVAALLNLVRLLASPRIGPRELAALFEELETNCARWREQSGHVTGSTPIAALFEDLERAAKTAKDSSHRAKFRLETEHSVRRLAARAEALLAEFGRTAVDFS